MSSRAGARVTSMDGYLPPGAEPPGLRIRADSEVDRVLVRDHHATGVRLVDGSELHADEVVLCAGTYGSPSVLLRSGIGPAVELRALRISVVADLSGVGRNLADHPGVDLDSGWRGDGGATSILHTIATFHSRTAASPAPDIMFWVADPAGAEPRFYFDPILLKPRSRGSVRLRSADPAERPRIELPGLVEDADLERLVEGYALGLDLANRPEIRKLCAAAAPPRPRSKHLARAAVLANAYSNPHVVGTCAMGPSPSDGAVVDHLARVHGVDGLRVVDASIIPAPPSGFPHLITLMLAEHVAARFDEGGAVGAA